MQEILTVSELTTAIKKQLESRFSFIQVRGEITNLKEQSSGHFYFTLKDADAQIAAVLFKGSAQSLSQLPKGGDQVVLKGELSLYAPRGNYQIIVRELEYLGVGQLLVKLHALKAKLAEKGWFEPSRKKKLPKYPRTIGVVTSPTGSVIQDILHVLTRRFSTFHLILNPVKVQGEGSAQEIAKAIDQFNRYHMADLLIVGRGGGSLEDLWAFNEEIVAQAIYNSKIPIISAVGHETDFCIADFVADLRAPTPSAAAEMAIAEKSQQLTFLNQAHTTLSGMLQTRTQAHRKYLDRIKKEPYFSSAYTLLGTQLQKIDDIKEDLTRSMQGILERNRLKITALSKLNVTLKPSTQVDILKQKLNRLKSSLSHTLNQQLLFFSKISDSEIKSNQLNAKIFNMIAEKRNRLKQLASHLKAIDPKNLLTKGYCILFQEKKDSVILSKQELENKQPVRIVLQDGQVNAIIQEALI